MFAKLHRFALILLRGAVLFPLVLLNLESARGDEPHSASKAKAEAGSPQATANANKGNASKPISFMRDVAPILVRNCIACHNPKKSESKYVMTNFTQLAKGGKASFYLWVNASDRSATTEGNGPQFVFKEPSACALGAAKQRHQFSPHNWYRKRGGNPPVHRSRVHVTWPLFTASGAYRRVHSSCVMPECRDSGR